MSLLLPLLLLLFSPLITGKPNLTSDRAALLAFAAAANHIPPLWLPTTSPCLWPGISCLHHRVTALHLPAASLSGHIPPLTIGNLTALKSLSLRFNSLSNPLPNDLPPHLRNLYLQHNRFSGEIPPAILSLRYLIHLNLAGNNFSGEIPPAFSNLSHLRTLFLQNNRFVGSVPDLVLPNLTQFNVSFNLISRPVPSGLRKFPVSAFFGTAVCGGPLRSCANADIGGSGLSIGAIVGIAVGSVMVLILLLLLLWRRMGSRDRDREVEAVAVSVNPVDVGAGEKEEMGKRLVFFKGNGEGEFDLEDLLRASAEVLGKGTFGTVYMAVLEVGEAVAVKRLRGGNIGEDVMREKIEGIGCLEHENLMPLRAYYYSKNEKLLVYDYMAMGSLSTMLHGSRTSCKTPLNWETRLSIALYAARGIQYIHSTGSTASHGNIKSSNILLTKSLNARVSDHGVAALAASTAALKHVTGYRAPELTDSRRVSQNADVYSFGVLILELLTGKDPSNGDDADLPRWVESVVREEWSTEVFDQELIRQRNAEAEMVKLLQLALDCTAQNPNSRPSMSRVVAKIEDICSASGGDAKIEEHQLHQVEPSWRKSGDDQFSQRTNPDEDS